MESPVEKLGEMHAGEMCAAEMCAVGMHQQDSAFVLDFAALVVAVFLMYL